MDLIMSSSATRGRFRADGGGGLQAEAVGSHGELAGGISGSHCSASEGVKRRVVAASRRTSGDDGKCLGCVAMSLGAADFS